ncbi:methyl-accepting chemotaxis protein [Cupriavidus sp. USMAA2-4]|uniref:methyl-accepting chemotaxis protein n=1 Tax=Cupriavidus sp. USMAA2-4 TaxID=876364 RepID=UPI0008A6E85E|nr:methyl-accepting chemotaxis protein [Cupriavidus sp. USMAA2-4]AOY91984.1 methyl-accepting chemotaxis protein [Cupriavidus sp. USMAA2-4]
MNLSQRLLLTLSLALLALLFVGLGGIWQMSRSEERFEYFNDNTLTSVRDLDTMERAVTAMRVALYRHALADTPELKSEAEGMLADAAKSFETALSKYEREDISDDTDRKMLETDRAAMSRYRAAQGPFLEKSRASGDAETHLMLVRGELDQASAALRKAILDHGDYNARMGAELVASNKAAYTFAVRAFSIAIAMAILITGVLAFSLYRRIHDSLAQIQGSLEHVSTTLDLGHRATVGRLDEVGRTADAFNRLVERVAATLGEVRRSTESVTVAASQIAAGNTDLSSRTEQQAASLEETASSMEELTTTVKHNADNARQASSLAANAASVAEQGSASVQQMASTMTAISDNAGRIAEITGLIEGIAFQTNILALNAAVEAARAGEQGRGFAVVAGEVRSLAQRSSSAAKEIKELIDTSVTTVREGSQQAESVGGTMEEIRQAVKRVSDIIAEIAAASGEQSAGITQVNQAVGQMDQVTQQNAALVEEAAAAAQSLDDQAAKLREAVGAFRLAAA